MTLLRMTVLGALALLATSARPAQAQDVPPLVVEARAGAALPVGAFRTGPDQGGAIALAPSFGLHFVYRSLAGWGPYIGFSQHRFDCTADGCLGAEYVATSWDLGMQRTLGRLGWARVGGLFGRMERQFAGPSAEPGGAAALHRASSLGLGAEAGVGLRVGLPGRMALTPGVRFGWLNTRFRDAGLVRMRWVSADLGLAFGF